MKLRKILLVVFIVIGLFVISMVPVAAVTFNPATEVVTIAADNGYFRVMAIKSQTYTGNEIKPELDVYDSKTGEKLKKGIDYKVSYSNNIYPNTGFAAKATVKGIGKCSDFESVDAYFSIFTKDISNDQATLTIYTKRFVYDGTAKKPEIKVVCGDVQLIENVDYELIYVEDNVNVGGVYFIVNGIGNYSGKQFGQFAIDPKPLLDEDIIVDLSDRVYTGEDINPDVVVKSGDKILVKDVDYTVSYPYNLYFDFTGQAWIEISGIGNYTGHFTKKFNILGKDITQISSINVDTSDKNYMGSFVETTVELKDGDYTLRKDKDYTVSYSNNNRVGQATVKIVGKGIYRGEITKTFNIVDYHVDIASVSSISIDTSDQTYTGNVIEPNVVLKDGNYTLEEYKDYRVIYLNNVNAGTATIRVEGRGIYTGEIVKTFNIVKKHLTGIASIQIDTSNKIYTGSFIEPSVVLKDGNYTLVDNIDYTVDYSNNYNPGTATITITGLGKYTGSIVKTFKIVQNDISKISTITINTSKKQYTGSAIATDITLQDGNYTLIHNKDYIVSYSNNKNCGVATVTITGKGAYTGKIVKTFNIVPRRIRITSLKNTLLRCVAMKWERDSSVSGYEIYRSKSANSGFTNVKTVMSNSLTSHTFVAQAKGTYYYKIRSYVTVNGTKIYSDFSDVQMVKVTK